MIGPRDPDRDIDDLLEDGGGELGNLYRRLPRYEPPRRLDRAILGEAARAVHSGKPPRRQRWIIGVGSAAGLVLAAGIAWRIGHDAMNRPAISTETAPTAVPRVVPVEPISEPARSRHDEPEPASSPLDSVAPAPPPAAATGAVSKRAASEIDTSRRQEMKAAAKAAPPPAPAPAPPPVQQAAQPAAPPSAFPADAKAKDEQSTKDNAAPAERETGAGGGVFRHRANRPSAEGALPESAPSSSVELRRDMQLAPEEWLAHIHQLLHEGRRQQAAESLRLFLRAHPDWEIPDDLRALQR